LDALGEALRHELQVPPAVTEVKASSTGAVPRLTAGAFELARQVYFLQHGSIRDAARAVIAAGVSDTENVTVVAERLQTWWRREGWPKRPAAHVFVIRDANYDGGLYRSERECIGVATGSGPAPRGGSCPQSPLPDSAYCYHHDPRPEYVAKRRSEGQRLAQSRTWDMVALAPLQAWMDRERKRRLADARAAGTAHWRSQGWNLVADAVGIDQTIVCRMMKGTHNGAKMRRAGIPSDTIRASTVARYLEHAGTTFRAVYGFDPPAPDREYNVCPGCGGYKNHQSATCRACHDLEGKPCPHVGVKTGKRCGTLTKHESGYCYRCRRIVFREHKPIPGRDSFVSVPMLILATGEYSNTPRIAWVARRMWAVNAAGVRDVFSSQKTLNGSLVKRFRKFGWLTVPDVQEAHRRLVAEHGPVAWPRGDGELPVEAAGVVPFDPFLGWLIERYVELGSYAKLARRLHMNPDMLSVWIRGVGRGAEKTTIRRAIVDRALEMWDGGTTFADLYETRPGGTRQPARRQKA
jgi:hypothetical protein